MGASTPDEEAIREAYARWRLKYNKGDFNPVRYANFKSNFLAVTAKNNMERNRARQFGETVPPPIQLNEYGDCSAEEYKAMMQQNPASRTRMATQSPGLQPTNDFNSAGNRNRQQQQQPQRQQQRATQPGMQRREQMSQANAQLRAAMEQRTNLENELVQLKQRLEEKQRLLQAAMNEEQFCKQRVALREEQKRILNDRLQNGWPDEKQQQQQGRRM
jgi:hypothetical protein